VLLAVVVLCIVCSLLMNRFLIKHLSDRGIQVSKCCISTSPLSLLLRGMGCCEVVKLGCLSGLIGSNELAVHAKPIDCHYNQAEQTFCGSVCGNADAVKMLLLLLVSYSLPAAAGEL